MIKFPVPGVNTLLGVLVMLSWKNKKMERGDRESKRETKKDRRNDQERV